MRMQNRLDHGLQPNALTHDLIAARDMAAQAHRSCVWHPHLWQEPASIKAGEHGRVDHVCLDPRLGNQMHLPRIGDDDAADERCHRLPNGLGMPVASTTIWSSCVSLAANAAK
jgi:hypothetical protein